DLGPSSSGAWSCPRRSSASGTWSWPRCSSKRSRARPRRTCTWCSTKGGFCTTSSRSPSKPSPAPCGRRRSWIPGLRACRRPKACWSEAVSMDAVVVETGLGNVRSVEKALETAAREQGLAAARIARSADPDRIRRADRLIVPGQGGFGEGARALSGELGEVLRERLSAGVPYLGICLGLQLLFEASEEAEGRGLGWFRGAVRALQPAPGIKIPHMG